MRGLTSKIESFVYKKQKIGKFSSNLTQNMTKVAKHTYIMQIETLVKKGRKLKNFLAYMEF